jgi:CHC2 zinc finger
MGKFIREQLPEPRAYFDNEELRLKGPGTWKTTRCVFHEGSDSMRVNTGTGSWVCMACGEKGGDVLAYHMKRHDLDFIEAAKALGAWEESGSFEAPKKPRPLSASSALQVLTFEATLTYIAACNVANGVALSAIDKERLLTAVKRITTIAEGFA